MLKKNVFSQKRFSFSGGFHRFIEQDVIVDNNSYVAGKNKIRNRRENKAVIGQSTGENNRAKSAGSYLSICCCRAYEHASKAHTEAMSCCLTLSSCSISISKVCNSTTAFEA